MSSTQLGRKMQIVLLDDDKALLLLVKKFLERAFSDSVELHGFTDPVAGLERIESELCDLVITDLQMPSINGLTILRAAKTRNAWTQVIMLTGNSTLDAVGQAIEAGACDYLVKPFSEQDLVLLVTQARDRMARWQDAMRSTLRSELRKAAAAKV